MAFKNTKVIIPKSGHIFKVIYVWLCLFYFFWVVIRNISPMKKIAILASGSGTNAESITNYFKHHPEIEVDVILSNRADAYVHERAKRLGVESGVFTREELKKPDGVAGYLEKRNINLVVLAGFLWLIPDALLNTFPGKIINIHPALLPAYGGKNMYGKRVHEAVLAAGEKESGITIHYVDEIYDHGKIIFQARCTVEKGDTPDRLAGRIHELEYKHYPKEIEKLLQGL